MLPAGTRHGMQNAQIVGPRPGRRLDPQRPLGAAHPGAVLVSPSDTLSEAQAKMQEYMANGSRLGWLIEPESRRVFVYRPGAPPEELDNPATVSGDPVLPGFVLDLSRVW